MIKLDKVSKFYSKNGVVSAGFTKLSIEFKMGEFVAITGESGSGKSTLLNVISGLDTYEEGEMYINGLETSHYVQEDFENYRRRYIGNIFQSFNLVNSYTVYQNIELTLILNGYKKNEVKEKITKIIKEVGLSKYKNTRASKLSGGQKQRVAIARALAKDTPIIIADEPTGNLDSKSSKEILKLLSEISKNKLVIIVTHNYEQIEEYVTRKIKMNDGKILEDKVFKNVTVDEDKNIQSFSDMKFFERILLAVRNTFNIVPKFLLLLFIFIFLTVCFSTQYSNYQKQKYEANSMGMNFYVNNTDDKRIIISKKDKKPFNDSEISNIKSLANVDYINKYDYLLDENIYFESENKNIYLDGYVNEINFDKNILTAGRMPKNENELVIRCGRYNYYCDNNGENLLNKTVNKYDYVIDKITSNYKIVGVIYDKNFVNFSSIFYLNDDGIKNTFNSIIIQNSTTTLYYDNKSAPVYIAIDNNLNETEIKISKDLMKSDVGIVNLELSNNLVDKSYQLNATGSEVTENENLVYISKKLYNEMFTDDIYQLSAFVKNTTKTNDVINYFNEQNYNVLAMKDAVDTSGVSEALLIINLFTIVFLIIVLFLISYFVIRIILKSRNTYFATIRILGATKKEAKNLLIGELFIVSTLSYVLYLLLALFNKIGLYDIKFLSINNLYMKITDYVFVYLIIVFISILISLKYSKKLFKNSAITTINEEV